MILRLPPAPRIRPAASDGTFNYAYDYNGNMVTKTEIATGKVTEYVWDYRNRLTNVRQKNSSNGPVVQEQIYRYDPLDRRIGVGTDPDGAGSQPATWQWTVYNGANPYADFDNSGSLTNRYLYGDAVDQIFARFSASGTAAWYLTDQIGSVRDIASPSGSILDHIKYESFGKIVSESNPSNGDRIKFAAREWDATTGQYNYRHRYYDAAIARFTSEDPLGLNAGDVNVYRYVGNSPTLATDPTGLAEEPKGGSIYVNQVGLPQQFPRRGSTIDCHRVRQPEYRVDLSKALLYAGLPRTSPKDEPNLPEPTRRPMEVGPSDPVSDPLLAGALFEHYQKWVRTPAGEKARPSSWGLYEWRQYQPYILTADDLLKVGKPAANVESEIVSLPGGKAVIESGVLNELLKLHNARMHEHAAHIPEDFEPAIEPPGRPVNSGKPPKLPRPIPEPRPRR